MRQDGLAAEIMTQPIVDQAFITGFARAARAIERMKRREQHPHSQAHGSLRALTRDPFLRGYASGMLVATGVL